MTTGNHQNDGPVQMDAQRDVHMDALIAEALAAEGIDARREAAPPSSAIVWWRAQMRARQEAVRTADRPITIVHALAIASGAGLSLALIGMIAAWGRGSDGWLTTLYAALAGIRAPLAAIDFTSRWILVPATAVLASLVLAAVAAYRTLGDE